MFRHLLFAVVLFTVIVALATGCGGGGGPASIPPGPGGAIDTSQALTAPLPSAPGGASEANVTELENWERIASKSQLLGGLVLAAQLDAWADRCKASPDDPAAQLGLSLSMLAAAGANSAGALGQNVFAQADVESVLAMATNPDLQPAQLAGDALLTMRGKGLPKLRGGTSGVQAQAFPPPADLKAYRAALRDYLLPMITSAEDRLAHIADTTPVTTRILSLPLGGERINFYAADFHALAAALQLVRTGLLMVVAVDPSYGSYNWDLNTWQRDANNDGIVTVAEWLPAAPFGAITAAEWVGAGTALRDATARMKSAVNARRTTDPQEALMKVLQDADITKLQNNLADAGLMLAGSVNVTADYYRGEVKKGSVLVPLNLRQMWDGPPANLKSLMPKMYVMTVHGKWKLSNGVTFELWEDTEDFTTGVVSYDGQKGTTWFDASGALSGAPHNVTASAVTGMPGFNLNFNGNWKTCSGTYGATSVTGNYVAPLPDRDTETKWDDIPDKTVSGIFPNPTLIKNRLIAGYWDKIVLKYKSIVIGG